MCFHLCDRSVDLMSAASCAVRFVVCVQFASSRPAISVYVLLGLHRCGPFGHAFAVVRACWGQVCQGRCIPPETNVADRLYRQDMSTSLQLVAFRVVLTGPSKSFELVTSV